MSNPTLLIVAGETSGDIIGGYLVDAIKSQNSAYHFWGVGSTQMEKAGVKIIINSEQLAVMGLFEILRNIKVIYRSMRVLTNILNTNPPDLLVLIDYPGFNLRLAEKAKKAGVKVMYYVSPQIWAWHYSRIHKIRQNVDLMAVLFPFEKNIYEKEGVPVKFVGHPIIENMRATLEPATAYREFNIDPMQPVIGLLPGSRSHEIRKLLPDMLEAIKLIKQKIPTAQFILPLAPNLPLTALKIYDLSEVNVVQHNTYNILQICHAAIVTSGTATLEVALFQVPLVILYKLNKVTYFIGKLFMRLKQFGLCNIVAEEKIAVELLQYQVTPEAISQEIIALLNNQTYRNQVMQKLGRLKNKLIANNAAHKAAEAAIELIKQTS
jgi:lipid-A-disaccharide synthase